MEKIEVSVCCLAYNHQEYIEKTLEGFINQKTTFRYEVLINDDASTDSTRLIIQKYAQEYPDIIKPIYQTVNQYSQGVSVQTEFNYTRAKGRYIAFCEGDDYWCDENKLQQQYDKLNQNEDCFICVHKTERIDRYGKSIGMYFPRVYLEEGVISAKEYIHNEIVVSPWLFQLSSFFIRREIIDDYINGFSHPFSVGDLPLVLHCLEYGDCYYINKVMSCYREDSGGQMSKIKRNFNEAVKQYESFKIGFEYFDKRTNGKYSEDFRYGIDYAAVQILKYKGEYRKILKKEYRHVLKNLSWKNKMLIIVGTMFPRIANSMYKKNKSR